MGGESEKSAHARSRRSGRSARRRPAAHAHAWAGSGRARRAGRSQRGARTPFLGEKKARQVLSSWPRTQVPSEKGTQGFVQTLTAAVWAPHLAQRNKRFLPGLGFVITLFY